MPTFAKAIEPRTVAQVRELCLLELAATGSRVSGWSNGAPQRAFLEGEATAIAAESILRVGLASTASIALCIAAGSTWVDAVMTFFDLDDGQGGKGRFKATKAVWQVPMKITASTPAQTINSTNASSIQVQAADGTIFVCSQQSTVNINSGTSYQGILQFTARTAGTSGNVNPGQITKMIAGPAGMSVDIAELQVQTTVARDEEDSASYIARGLGRWARLGAGWVLPAFDNLIPEYGNNGSTLNVTRWYVDQSNPNGPGTIQVYLANASGPATAPEVAAVDTGLNSVEVKPVGTGEATVVAAGSHALVITATVLASGTNLTLAADAASAINVLEQAFPLGPATLEPDLVRAILMGAEIASQTIETATGETKVIDLSLPGFASVISIVSCSLAAPEVLAIGDALQLTLILTVTT